jgi:hypothetical protein
LTPFLYVRDRRRQPDAGGRIFEDELSIEDSASPIGFCTVPVKFANFDRARL